MEHNEMMANPIRHIRFIGYGLTNAWSFMLLFVPLVGAHDSTTVVSGSMLSGALCGLILLLVSPKLQTIAGRKVLSFLFALGASIGTLLYAYPIFPSSPLALLGLLLSGFCFIGIVASEKEGKRLEITIFDNGKGIEKDTLQEICEKLNQQVLQDEFKSIGLQNVQARLKLLFGEE